MRMIAAMMRFVWRRMPWRIRIAVTLAILICGPLLLLNGAVAFFGSSVVFPLSPRHVNAKWSALKAYARHRPGCLISGHDDLAPAIAAAEKKHRLPAGLFAAVVRVESDAAVHRISAAGAMGPAQLIPTTAALMAVLDPYDPVQSVDGGAKYLARQLKKYGDVRLALAAYNAGPGSVTTFVPKNGETEYYVKKVMNAWKRG
jgi:soluble lytic murein transglycosylase-like protein